MSIGDVDARRCRRIAGGEVDLVPFTLGRCKETNVYVQGNNLRWVGNEWCQTAAKEGARRPKRMQME